MVVDGRYWLAPMLALAMAGAVAAPEDDFRAGEKAYHSGDVIGAMSTLRRAADAGHAPAQALLADLLDKAEFNEEAIGYYRKAAEQNNAAGEFGLGTMYLTGEGVKADRGQALFWYARAAERNHEGAIKALAIALMNPPAGEETKVDNAALLRWMRRAAELELVPAMERLASSYRTGVPGLAADAAQAQSWTERAAAVKKRQAGTPPKKQRRPS